jgi:hypothetical protein
MQHPKRRGRDDEHVDRHGADQVIVQKAAPSRGGTFRAPRKVPPDCALAKLDAELGRAAPATCFAGAVMRGGGWEGRLSLSCLTRSCWSALSSV